MFKSKLTITKLLITIVLTLGVSISFQSLLAAWTAPTAAPPGDNMSQPLDTSATFQTKAGDLGISGNLLVDGNTLVVDHVNNRVGIGTGNPSAPLDLSVVSGTAIEFDNGDSIITVHDGFGNFNIKSGVDDNNIITSVAGGSHIMLDESGYIYLSIDESTAVGGVFSAGTKLMLNNGIIRTDGEVHMMGGNVGIGTVDPETKLEIGGQIRITNPWRGIQLVDSSAGGHRYDFIVGAIGGTAGRFGIYDDTAGAYRFNIDSNGNVGIGDIAPDVGLKLDVAGKIGATEYCDENGGNCTVAADLGGYVDTNAETVCPSGEYLDGDGNCKTPKEIVGAVGSYTRVCGTNGCTVNCDAGDIRTGCGNSSGGNAHDNDFNYSHPTGVNGCYCKIWADSGNCYAICLDTN